MRSGLPCMSSRVRRQGVPGHAAGKQAAACEGGRQAWPRHSLYSLSALTAAQPSSRARAARAASLGLLIPAARGWAAAGVLEGCAELRPAAVPESAGRLRARAGGLLCPARCPGLPGAVCAIAAEPAAGLGGGRHEARHLLHTHGHVGWLQRRWGSAARLQAAQHRLTVGWQGSGGRSDSSGAGRCVRQRQGAARRCAVT